MAESKVVQILCHGRWTVDVRRFVSLHVNCHFAKLCEKRFMTFKQNKMWKTGLKMKDYYPVNSTIDWNFEANRAEIGAQLLW